TNAVGCPGLFGTESCCNCRSASNESTRIVDDIREVIEGLELIGIIVDRIAAARWIFDAYTVVEITSRHVVSQPSADTTVFEARHDSLPRNIEFLTSNDNAFSGRGSRRSAWRGGRAG